MCVKAKILSTSACTLHNHASNAIVARCVTKTKTMNHRYPGLKTKDNQAAAIVAKLSLEEKASLCSGQNFWHTQGIVEKGVPSIMLTDGPHGLRKQSQAADHVGLNKSVPATCFPTASALAASWDVDLIQEVGVALGEQCIAENVAVLLGPGLNIKRHPLCGRNFEYFSEDPLLSGKIAAAFVRGVQSQGVGTSAKHFAVNNQEHARMFVDAIVDPRTLREIYLKGFEIVVKEAQPWTVMCAYNRVNGTYCSENDLLLNQILRDDWGFEGLVVTDWGAANDRVKGISSGLDLEMPGSGGINDKMVMNAVKSGKLDETTLNVAAKRNVSLALLGQDIIATSKALDTHKTLDTQAHHNLARRAAAESMVLLKNEDEILPIKENTSVAVIGAFAKTPRYQGAGSSQVNPSRLDNLWQSLAEYSDALLYAPGYDPVSSEIDEPLIADAAKAAKQADLAVVYVGLPAIYESEGFDRTHMNLPQQHNDLVEAICDANENTVVILSNGAPVSMPWVNRPKAIVEAYLAGQAGGSALADILYGSYNPSGKLGETFPISVNDIPSNSWFPGKHRQVQYREGLNVGYRYFNTADAEVLFPFGHGLSYTRFTYDNLQIVFDEDSSSEVEVKFDLSNTGTREGAEVSQCYVCDKHAPVYRPHHELKAFVKTLLQPGEKRQVSLTLNKAAFSWYNPEQGIWVVEPGTFEIQIGSSSRDIRLNGVYQWSCADAGKVQDKAQDMRTNIEAAQDTHVNASRLEAMPRNGGLPYIATSDDEFERMLMRPLPPPETARPFHPNSSIGELGSSTLGKIIKQKFISMFLASMGGESSDRTLNKMFTEMASNMPLRAIVLFSRGKVTHTHMEILVAILNRAYSKAISTWARHKIEHNSLKLK